MSKMYWEEIYKNMPITREDSWLDKYRFLLKGCCKILDLGCGNGANEKYLEKINIFPMVCDISENAINVIHQLYPRCEAKIVDISKNLPYGNKKMDLIIADLSLHYFDNESTFKIITELKRILNDNGFVIGRVNAKQGIKKNKNYLEIEKDFFEENGCFRRYFSRDDIEKFFQGFRILVNSENVTYKYGDKKYVIEFLLQKVE